MFAIDRVTANLIITRALIVLIAHAAEIFVELALAITSNPVLVFLVTLACILSIKIKRERRCIA